MGRYCVGAGPGRCFAHRAHSSAALVSVLRPVQVQSPLLYLCDNEAVLRDVARWIGEGHKASMSTNKDADILTDIIQRLHLRVAAGAATFLLKVKSHRGEVLNEMADVAAENGRGKDDDGGTFTKASGKLVLSVEKDGKLMQSTWTKESKPRSGGKGGNT